MSVNGFLDWLQQSALHWMLKLVERDVVPDFIIRMGIQHLLRTGEAAKMSAPFEQLTEEKSAFVAELKTMPVAVNTQDANEQHYEVPTAYFQHVLGKWMKYSSCLYRSPSDSLDEAEQNMLALYCSRAQLEDGQDVLELGCGWGSVALFVASAYPRSRVTAVSNSRTQKEFIMGKADQLGLTNLQVITANMVDFKAPGTYDRIISVEMLEHMKNYKTLLERCSSWLRPNGLLFVHIFVHRWLCYHFEVRDERDWMSRHFFTGGTMPSYDIFMYFQDHLALQHAWYVNGSHYSRTLEAWLKRQDARRTDIMRIFEDTYGAEQALAWWVRWRLFYLACSELFNYNGGNDWGLGHYLFKKHA